MLVKIISGTYGHAVGGLIEPKDRRSEPFELENSEAKRIIELGIAEAIDGQSVIPTMDNGQSRTPVPTNGGFLDDEQLAAMTNKELKELAENLGIDTTKLKKKDDYITAICEADIEFDADDEGNMIPSLGAEAPVI